MRKVINFQIIRYFPREISEEFINVGVILHGEKNTEKTISEEQAKKLYCPVFNGGNEKFSAMVKYLNKLQRENKLYDPHQYFHNFNYSEVKHMASKKSKEVILDDLFHQYIGYKLF